MGFLYSSWGPQEPCSLHVLTWSCHQGSCLPTPELFLQCSRKSLCGCCGLCMMFFTMSLLAGLPHLVPCMACCIAHMSACLKPACFKERLPGISSWQPAAADPLLPCTCRLQVFKMSERRNFHMAAPGISSLEAGNEARRLVQPLQKLTLSYEPSVWGPEVQMVARAVALALQWGLFDMVSSTQVADVRARCGHE